MENFGQFCAGILLILRLTIVNQRKMSAGPAFFHDFRTDVSAVRKPARFTFPFCYEPHPLAAIAAGELQDYLQTQTDFAHPFGLTDRENTPIGKMFGVLVTERTAENGEKRLGYLAAFSGKLASTNRHPFFVPPVFDMLTEDGFFRQEEETINQLNREIERLEQSPDLPDLRQCLETEQTSADKALAEKRTALKAAKADRKAQRESAKERLNGLDYSLLEEDLIRQSHRDQHEYDLLKAFWKDKLAAAQNQLYRQLAEIERLKNLRKSKSSSLQQWLFEQYRFRSAEGRVKSLLDIFRESRQMLPPAGAGECAAPKLLQYAHENHLKPVAMAEFWWGAAPASEIRKHRHFYPACKGKCAPILSHMLKGLPVDPDPMLENPVPAGELEIVYEDADIIVVDKPAELLSVPGIHVRDSVYTRILAMRPEVSGPVVIHRLDMSTSGLLVLAKHKEAHWFIQRQFIARTVEKRYAALLDGTLETVEGLVDLPLRVDLDDRPRQLVCHDHGRPAQTRYRALSVENGRTRVHFFPLTGRTHQLRIHAAHPAGLDCPIVGDDLYGKRADRLCLHAGRIAFVHPRSGKRVEFVADEPF